MKIKAKVHDHIKWLGEYVRQFFSFRASIGEDLDLRKAKV
jgi:hypothetical protein